ncbi:MarR family winged helix-turn-helix transcriptional regulator [Candidatus Omnitrophota bacterium]
MYNLEKIKNKPHEDIAYGVGEAYNLLTKKLTSILKDHDFSLSKFNILMVIKHVGRNKGISQEGIGNKLIVTASNMSRMIDKLEKEELVRRGAQEGNRRVNLIFITKKGSDLLDRIWPSYEKRLKEIGSILSSKDQKILAYLLDKWNKGLSTE